MRSAANFKGHAIHAAIIPFPFAFLLGAFGFDLAGRLLETPSFWLTGRHLAVAGIVAALIAAIPGFIDYLRTVPPRSTGKQRATKHLLLNLSAVAVFVIATSLRGDVATPQPTLLLLLEAGGAGMLIAAGWMGGTLVNRNQIGVDHRYAGAGKWKEQSLDAQHHQPILAGSMDALKVDQMMLLHVNGKRVVLARTDSGYLAFADRCTHRGGSLADGVMICGTVQCPWHGSQFDARTGAVKAGPATEAIEVYKVREQDGRVFLEIGAGLPDA
jgi:nitrite reductase/ring-hydroxylating ferredoxin subunit/uncharacterized membrane protein